MTTKRQLISDAFRHLGLASYAMDATADEMKDAQRDLDVMMQLWSNKSLKLGYDFDGTDLDGDSGVAPAADGAISAKLAIQMAPSYGRNVSSDLKSMARSAYSTLLGKAMTPKGMQPAPRSSPAGAGHRHGYGYDTFLPDPDPLEPNDLSDIETG